MILIICHHNLHQWCVKTLKIISIYYTVMKTLSLEQLPPGWLVYEYVPDEYRVNYSWKMAVRSIWYVRHNEFWMIWTEIVPLVVFLLMFCDLVHSDKYLQMDSFKQLLCNMMYFAAICCRCCSLIYHTFNCLSLKMNTALINLDLIGIATNALGVPWITYLYFEKHYVENLYVRYLICSYFLIFSWMFIQTNLFHLRCFFDAKYVANNDLLYLGIVGNIPTNMVVMYASSLTYNGRICLMCGQLFLLSGFVLFYRLKVPESVLGYHKLMNSHIFWHIFTFAGQYCFLLTAFW